MSATAIQLQVETTALYYLVGLNACIQAQSALLEASLHHIQMPHILSALLVVKVRRVPAHNCSHVIATVLFASAIQEAQQARLLMEVPIQPDKTCALPCKECKASVHRKAAACLKTTSCLQC